MRRTIPIVVALVLSVTSASAVASEPGTGGSTARTYVKPGGRLDPVLNALSEGRLVRSVDTLRPGQVEPSAVPVGFALAAAELAALNVTDTTLGRQEVDAFVARLRQQGVLASASEFTVYALPPVQEAVDAARQRQGGETDPEAGPLDSALIVPSTTAVELVGAVFEAGQLHVKATVSAAGVPRRLSGGQALLSHGVALRFGAVDAGRRSRLPGDQRELDRPLLSLPVVLEYGQ